MQREYVDDREGFLYVAGTRVSLASIIYAFRDGASPETIQQDFPVLTLPEVYGAIAFYLNHPEESEAYLQKLNHAWEELERNAPPMDEKLRAKIEEARRRLMAGQK